MSRGPSDAAGALMTACNSILSQADNRPSLEDCLEKQIGKYRLLKKIGEGGMGEVYLARNEETGREVALKILPSELTRNTQYIERFRREATAVAKLEHPHIIKVYEIDEQDGVHFFSMEYLGGLTLRSFIDQSGRIPIPEAVAIITDIAGALEYAHSQGIIHRDVKPDNIIADESGAFKVMDFGIARMEEGTQLTVTGSIMGTPDYMSPEQASGKKVDLRADIYSLGIVFYEMVTGRLPFSGKTAVEVLQMHLKQAPESPKTINPDIPGRLASVINKMLEKQPADRYASFRHVTNAIGQAVPRTMRAAAEAPARTIMLKQPRKAERPPPRVRERIVLQTPARVRAALALSIIANLALFGYLLFRPAGITGVDQMQPALFIGGRTFAPPAISDGLVYLGAEDGTLYACEPRSGEVEWSFKTGNNITAAPVVDGNRLYVGSWDQCLYALDTSDGGRVIWKVNTGGTVFAAPVLADGILYLCTREGGVFAIDAATGEEMWKAASGDSVRYSPAIKDGILFVSAGDRKLVAYNAADGRHIDEISTDRMKTQVVPIEEKLYVVTFADATGRDELSSIEIRVSSAGKQIQMDRPEWSVPLEPELEPEP